jgi:hypothetical protein
MGAAQGRPAVACLLYFGAEGGIRKPSGPNGCAGQWAVGPIGPKSGRNLFELKIGFLNL